MRVQISRLVVVSCTVALLLPVTTSDACTTFLLKHPKGPVMAKNFDWDVAAGMLVVNPRGLAKSAVVGADAQPARWTSRYGSLTFNQYGREFPMGGMNEAGLAMEVLWLADTRYPAASDKRSIGTLQWVQYCLDSFRSVNDVVASASELNIGGPATVHFLACDATATCAVIEFLDGKLFQRSGRTLPLPVLTNDRYNASLDYLNRTLGYGGDPVKPEGAGSLPRFARAANGTHIARSNPDADPVAESFAILADVAQPKTTQWSIVYDLSAKRVHFSSSSHAPRRTVDLTELDLDCTAETLTVDLAAELSGDITTKLVPYTTEANRTLIEAGFSTDALARPPDEAISAMAAYPERLLCTFEPDGE
jgi:choloylglycine hydrolase